MTVAPAGGDSHAAACWLDEHNVMQPRSDIRLHHIAPAAAWYYLIFFTKKFSQSENFL